MESTSPALKSLTGVTGVIGQTATMTMEEELTQAANNLNIFDEICDAVGEFEQLSFETKMRINSIQKFTQQSLILPQSLKMCFGLLKKYLAQEKPDFDQIENIEQDILEEIKISSSLNKEFGKFKGEFFVMNEPIINKDLGSLNLNLV